MVSVTASVVSAVVTSAVTFTSLVDVVTSLSAVDALSVAARRIHINYITSLPTG